MKKALAILVLALLLALSACGQKSAETPADTEAADAEAVTEAADAEDTEDAEIPEDAEDAEIPEDTEDAEAPADAKGGWTPLSEDDALVLCPPSCSVPEEAENVAWYALNGSGGSEGVPGMLVELRFDLHDNHFTLREQVTQDETADLSGLDYPWTIQDDDTLNGSIPCRTARYIGDEGYVDLCTWYDSASGVSYALWVAAEDLDGFDLLAVAEAVVPAAA